VSDLYHVAKLDLNVAICTDAYPASALTAELVFGEGETIAGEIVAIAEREGTA
jgi:hypothetical protein